MLRRLNAALVARNAAYSKYDRFVTANFVAWNAALRQAAMISSSLFKQAMKPLSALY